MSSDYKALTLETLPERLSKIEPIANKLGMNYKKWSVSEIGDGNLNLVFIVRGESGKIIIKQALPYMRLVGDGWPLTLDRAYFEYNALVRQERSDPGSVPFVHYFDRAQGLIAMEYLENHNILRGKLILGEKIDGLADTMGNFCARLAFKGSDLYMDTKEKKYDVSLFQKNVELMDITETFVFTDPYFDAEKNHNTPGLDSIISLLRSDPNLKANAHHMLRKFTSNCETMCHGDLHSGSIMCTENKTRIIDPEFAFYGPMGFDVGMLISNFLMAFFSQPGHRKSQEELDDYQDWILRTIQNTVEIFLKEFTFLWRNHRSGILYPKKLFEDQGHDPDAALQHVLQEIWLDAVTICGIEMHRRCLSLAHNADFEDISDVKFRAKLEARNLLMGRDLILNAGSISEVQKLLNIAQEYNEKDPF